MLKAAFEYYNKTFPKPDIPDTTSATNHIEGWVRARSWFIYGAEWFYWHQLPNYLNEAGHEKYCRLCGSKIVKTCACGDCDYEI
jgi:hypothetical protein